MWGAQTHMSTTGTLFRIRGALLPDRWRRWTTVYWIVWPSTSEPQGYKALVDTGVQGTLMPSNHREIERICISRVTRIPRTDCRGSWNESGLTWVAWAPYCDWPRCLRGYWWASAIAPVETEEKEQLSISPSLSEDPSIVGHMRVKEQKVSIASITVHRQQYHPNQDSLIPIQKLIHQLESQGVISKMCSPFNSPMWPVGNSIGVWQ